MGGKLSRCWVIVHPMGSKRNARHAEGCSRQAGVVPLGPPGAADALTIASGSRQEPRGCFLGEQYCSIGARKMQFMLAASTYALTVNPSPAAPA